MGSWTDSDGIDKAITVFAVPSFGVLIAVALTDAYLGELAAGLLYLLLVASTTFEFCQAAINQKTMYMVIFVAAGFVLVFLFPDIASEILHPVYGAIGTVIYLIGLLVVAGRLAERFGLVELVLDW